MGTSTEKAYFDFLDAMTYFNEEYISTNTLLKMNGLATIIDEGIQKGEICADLKEIFDQLDKD
jgi:hypothetical protein